MVQQEIQTDAHQKKSRDHNKSKQQGKSPNAGANSKHRFPRGYSSQKESINKKEKRRKLDNEDDYPIHGSSHKWGQCHQNQYGNNFKPYCTTTSISSNQSHSRSHRSSFLMNFQDKSKLPEIILTIHRLSPLTQEARPATTNQCIPLSIPVVILII